MWEFPGLNLAEVLDRQNSELRVLFCVNFLVVNLDYVQWRQLTGLKLFVPFALAEFICIVNYYFFPVLSEVRVWYGRFSEVIKFVQILEESQIDPSSLVTKCLKFSLCELETATKHHIIFKRENWVIKVQFLIQIIDQPFWWFISRSAALIIDYVFSPVALAILIGTLEGKAIQVV